MPRRIRRPRNRRVQLPRRPVSVAAAVGTTVLFVFLVGCSMVVSRVEDSTSEMAGSTLSAPTPTMTFTPNPSSSSAPASKPIGAAAVERGTGQAQHDGTSNLVTDVVDGDTFRIASGEQVRVLGIDSCEAGTPGGDLATADARTRLVAENVTLRAEPGVDRDPYGRLLRYVQLPTAGDFGETMVPSPHTGVYEGDNDASPAYVTRLTELDGPARDCGSPDPTPTPAPSTDNTEEPDLGQPVPDTGSARGGCEPGYSPCVPAYPPDLDCDDLSGPYDVTGSDPHRLDGNGDGEGCESGGS